VETPFGRAEDALGGTAVYFSLAAGRFTRVQLVGVVGQDFPREGIELLRGMDVDLSGLQRQPGETFRWVGTYDYDMNVAHTLDTRLNVFETFHPTIPEHYRDARLVFLGNIDPELQLEVLRQVRRPTFVALDTMNFWIERKKEALTQVVGEVDAVLLNESEIRQYTGRYSVFEAARELQRLGPACIVVKRGEYGALLFAGDDIFLVPAYPTGEVRDPTGAGDSFAGGFIGYLDSCASLDLDSLRAGAVYGTVLASFTVEDFSVRRLQRATEEAVRDRILHLAQMTRIEAPRPSTQRDLIPEGV
jgi:sugar/nucleoside kinase (ribokinase family)